MSGYTKSFEAAIDHAMLYEVGGFWNVNAPGVKEGLIGTAAQRKAVGYVNDPVDRGGETKFGVAVRANPDLDITRLTWDGAKRVYYRRYWLAANCDDLTIMSPRLAVLHFDGAVNHGVGRAGRFLQRAVSANQDGDVGPATLKLVQQYIDQGAEFDVLNRICDIREAFYQSIVANDPTQKKYLGGWLRRIKEMRAFTTDPKRTFA